MHLNFKIIAVAISLTLLGSMQAENQIKPGLNFLKSAAVPGWGQLSLQKDHGWGFIALEAGFWLMNFHYNSESDNKADASHKYAGKYANIDVTQKYSHQFYEDMRYFLSSGFEDGGYNAAIAAQAADKYPDDPLKQQQYLEQYAYDEQHYWKWETANNKREYSVYRKRIEEYADVLKVLGGAIAANHILSAFDALRLSNQMKRMQFSVSLNSLNTPLLSCTYKF